MKGSKFCTKFLLGFVKDVKSLRKMLKPSLSFLNPLEYLSVKTEIKKEKFYLFWLFLSAVQNNCLSFTLLFTILVIFFPHFRTATRAANATTCTTWPSATRDWRSTRLPSSTSEDFSKLNPEIGRPKIWRASSRRRWKRRD